MPQRIAFIGAGSVGSVVGGLLSKSGHDVTLVDQWPEHVDAIKRNGLRLSGSVGEQVSPVKALHLHELQSVQNPFDTVFVTVKSYDTEWAATMMLRYATPDAPFISLQNCINDDRLAGVAGRQRTLGCVTTISTGLYEPGHAMRTDSLDSGVFKTGELDGSDTIRVREIVALLSDAGTSHFTSELFAERWAKLATNCALNALVGISGYGTVEMIRDAQCRRMGARAAGEAVRVAHATGHNVLPIMGVSADEFASASEGRGLEELEQKMLAYADRTQNTGIASFGQDILKGRRTEIDYLNGYVADLGRQAGVPTPVCDALVKLVNSQPAGKFKPDASLIEPLYDQLF
ncbi:MAG: ketopantoate reductase family protein [Dehalococcoidia bacterium]